MTTAKPYLLGHAFGLLLAAVTFLIIGMVWGNPEVAMMAVAIAAVVNFGWLIVMMRRRA